jgi:hypothetical protein
MASAMSSDRREQLDCTGYGAMYKVQGTTGASHSPPLLSGQLFAQRAYMALHTIKPPTIAVHISPTTKSLIFYPQYVLKNQIGFLLMKPILTQLP